MSLTSRNPATEEVIATYEELSDEEVKKKIDLAEQAFKQWKHVSFADRAQLMTRVGVLLKEKKKELGEMATKEMGKPISAAIGEVDKCALACAFYAQNAEKFLAPEHIKTEATESYIAYEPLGIILAVMPWNFPYWQVIRFAAPTLMAGNVGLLKHASNVSGCSVALEKIFLEAGFPEGVFQSLLISSPKVEAIIRDARVKAVTLTGSEMAGSKVASVAGQEIKKSVLELGGSDPFIVLADADLETSVVTAATARLQNAGQSCIAAKRFIVEEPIAHQFISGLKDQFESLILGNPLEAVTQIGPLATSDIRESVMKQVEESVSKGARLVTGGKQNDGKGFFYPPTILSHVKPGMPAYHEEVFGPVASVMIVKNADEAIDIANDTSFGLGASLWTKNLDLAKQLVPKIQAGSVFVNAMVKSDPRLPFGGINRSGYGRELSHYGIREFVNVKTVSIT